MFSTLTKPVGISYLVLLITLALAGWLHLATLLITILFSSFALAKLHFAKPRWLAVVLFLILVAATFSGFAVFFKKAIEDLPQVVQKSIPGIVAFADRHNIDLPFDDMQSLKEVATNSVKEALGALGNFARIATKEFLMLVVGVIIAIGIFVNGEEIESNPQNANLYSYSFALLANRFRGLYRSFETVMGAQLIISGINTVVTSIFVLVCSLPYAGLVIPITFMCGMLPIIGNVVSNTLIVGIAFGVSPQMAVAALIFLVVVHKLEYFLNSKIVGSRIRHPMWMTLVAMILGECCMGIPGIILAPVVLNFIKVEGSRFRVPVPAPEPATTTREPESHTAVNSASARQIPALISAE